MSITNPRYCAAGLYKPGSTSPTLMSAGGKVILFDTFTQAQDVLPILGNGRITLWNADQDIVTFHPIEAGNVNRICILTGYDPYDLPPNMPSGILSETRGMPWRYHVHYAHWMHNCGQMEKQSDGSYVNTAVERR